jgi:hypothetical protein
MRAGVIGVGEPQQNGDVESEHHHLRTAMDQTLKMRGSREFASVEDYEKFVYGVCLRGHFSAGRAEREYLGMLALALEHGLENVEAVIEQEGPLTGLDKCNQHRRRGDRACQAFGDIPAHPSECRSAREHVQRDSQGGQRQLESASEDKPVGGRVGPLQSDWQTNACA